MHSLTSREDVLPLHIAVNTSRQALWGPDLGGCGPVEPPPIATTLSAVDIEGVDAVNLDLRQLTFCDSRGCETFLCSNASRGCLCT
jgi:hypothetical protein